MHLPIDSIVVPTAWFAPRPTPLAGRIVLSFQASEEWFAVWESLPIGSLARR
jgi:hypothetical protein